jgi:MFS family permease
MSDIAAQRRILLAGLIGTTIEWFDFFLYGTMAALVFNRLFFPELSETAGTLASFATFAAGFVTRPLGGLIMGHLGDRIGRKSALVLSLSLMGGATFAIGCLPTYAAIGITAPVLLTVMRVFQGLALGGEWSGAVTLVMEHAPPDKRGRWGQWVQIGSLGGIGLSTGTVLILSQTLSDDQFFDWGWRVPFLLSALLLAVGLFIRLRIDESPVFKELERTHRQSRVPVFDAVRLHWWSILRVTGMHLAVTTLAFTATAFLISYGVRVVGYSRTDMLEIVCIAVGVGICINPFLGRAVDAFGRKRLYLVGALGMVAMGFPAFAAFNTGSYVGGVVAILALLLPSMTMYVSQGAWFPELFPPQYRVTGAGLGVQLATVILGGPAPTIATWLLDLSDGHSWSVSLWLCIVGSVSACFVLLTPETRPVTS